MVSVTTIVGFSFVTSAVRRRTLRCNAFAGVSHDEYVASGGALSTFFEIPGMRKECFCSGTGRTSRRWESIETSSLALRFFGLGGAGLCGPGCVPRG